MRKRDKPSFFKSRAISPSHKGSSSSQSVSPSDGLLVEGIRGLRDELKKERQIRTVDKMTGPMKKLFPSGIQYPDDMVRNKHLYMGGEGKARL